MAPAAAFGPESWFLPSEEDNGSNSGGWYYGFHQPVEGRRRGNYGAPLILVAAFPQGTPYRWLPPLYIFRKGPGNINPTSGSAHHFSAAQKGVFWCIPKCGVVVWLLLEEKQHLYIRPGFSADTKTKPTRPTKLSKLNIIAHSASCPSCEERSVRGEGAALSLPAHLIVSHPPLIPVLPRLCLTL